MRKQQTFNICILRACNWDYEKAYKLQNLSKSFDDVELEILLNSIKASDELAMGEVNASRLYKILNHINKNKNKYIAITYLSIIIITSGAMSFAMASNTIVASKSVIVASSSLPNFSISRASTMINTLITNLIKLGVLATVASCVFEMLKYIVEGNISRLPKTLITHAMMCCSVLLAPTVFNYISNVFNMGSIIGML